MSKQYYEGEEQLDQEVNHFMNYNDDENLLKHGNSNFHNKRPSNRDFSEQYHKGASKRFNNSEDYSDAHLYSNKKTSPKKSHDIVQANNMNRSKSKLLDYMENVKENTDNYQKKLLELAQARVDNDNKNKKIADLENIKNTLIEENELLNQKIESYQIELREIETKVNELRTNNQTLEEDNLKQRDEIHTLKSQVDDLEFNIKVKGEKEKISENCVKAMKEKIKEYENTIKELENDSKEKEMSMQKEFEVIEENLNQKIYELEAEVDDLLKKNGLSNKDNSKIIEKLKKQNEDLQKQISQTELFLKKKEEEFIEIVDNKDRKLKDLDSAIKMISEEAQLQVQKLTDSVMTFSEKIQYYKQREIELLEEISHYESIIKQHSDFNNKINKQGFDREVYSSSKHYISTDRERDIVNKSVGGNQTQGNQKDINYLNEVILDLEEKNRLIKLELEDYKEKYVKETDEYQDSVLNYQLMLNKKDEEISSLIEKIKKIDGKCHTYEDKLTELQRSYKEEYFKKVKQLEFLKDYYEKMIEELSVKLNSGVVKETHIVHETSIDIQNNSNIPHRENDSFNRGNTSKQKYYRQDEEISRKINQQLESIKNKLDHQLSKR